LNRLLARSACFSTGVHLLLLLPFGFLPAAGGEWAADVVRGASSVELMLVPLVPETGEGISRPAVPPLAQSFSDEGVIVDWRSLALKNDPPRYPWIARVNGWEGTAVIQVLVGLAGRAEQVVVRQSSGHAILDQAARASLQGWTFRPARKSGKDEASWVEIPVSFRLQTDQRK
jgi:TonB family protein